MLVGHPRSPIGCVPGRIDFRCQQGVSLRCAAIGILLLTVIAAIPSVAVAERIGFDIRLEFGGGLTASQQDIFDQAERTWESIITGYKPGVWGYGVRITAEGVADDGVGGRLGGGAVWGVTQGGGFWLSTSGKMTFDSADLPSLESNGMLYSVILHEMAHVFGFGLLWESNHLYGAVSGQYTGAAALAAYRSEFNQPNAAFVPVEQGGGSGTAGCHWNEVDKGSGLTGITNGQGRDMRDELMTGWLNSSPSYPPFLSQTTIQSFADMGYAIVPEPGVLTMLLGLVFMSLCRLGLRRGVGVPTPGVSFPEAFDIEPFL